MAKLFAFFVLLFVISLEANIANNTEQKIELQADFVGGDTHLVTANGHVKIRYKSTLIKSDYVIYDRDKKLLNINGNVYIRNPDGTIVRSDKLTINTQQSKVVFDKFFYKDEKKLWISSTKAKKYADCFSMQDAIMSTCLTNNPDWHLSFLEADYNSTAKNIKLKDIKFYIKETPVLYLPYLSFSTNRDRTTGLLIPNLGYNDSNGYMYEQPIFLAMRDDLDIELNPQIRTKRGDGIYATMRFVDSEHSHGSLRLGYFLDKQSFVDLHNIDNKEHYGMEAHYESDNIFTSDIPSEMRDALYADLILMNDIDYLNLQKTSLKHDSDSHIKESRIDYSIYNQNNFFGINANWFIDTKLQSNSQTLQMIPSFKWHKSNSALLSLDDLSYSVDIEEKNYIRHNKIVAEQVEVDLPIDYHLDILDGWIKFKFSESIYANMTTFNDNLEATKNYNTVALTHTIGAYGDLIKAYDTGMHTLEWSLDYSKQSHFADGIKEYNDMNVTLQRDFLSHKPYDSQVEMTLNHYWYSNDLKLYFKQRLTQIYYPESINKWDTIRNEVEVKYDRFSFVNLAEYSYKYNNFSEVSNKIRYNGEQLDLVLEKFWRKDLLLDIITTNELAFGIKYNYSKELNIFASFTYDIEHSYSKKWQIGAKYNRVCWGLELAYLHDTQPVLLNSGSGSIDHDAFIFKLNLLTFG